MGEVNDFVYHIWGYLSYCSLTRERLNRKLQEDGYYKQSRIGTGSFGEVYQLRKNNWVVKMIYMNDEEPITHLQMKYEFEIARRLGEANIGVPIIATYSNTARRNLTQMEKREIENNTEPDIIIDEQKATMCKENAEAYIVMERGQPVPQWGENEVRTVFEKIHSMCQMGIFCMDMKPANAVIYNNDIRLIDFSLDFCPYENVQENFYNLVKHTRANWLRFFRHYVTFTEEHFEPIHGLRMLHEILFNSKTIDDIHNSLCTKFHLNYSGTDKAKEAAAILSCYMFGNMCGFVDFMRVLRELHPVTAAGETKMSSRKRPCDGPNPDKKKPRVTCFLSSLRF